MRSSHCSCSALNDLPAVTFSNARLDPLGGGEQRILAVSSVFHHRDNVGERLVVLDLVCFLKIFLGEALRSSCELFAQLA